MAGGRWAAGYGQAVPATASEQRLLNCGFPPRGRRAVPAPTSEHRLLNCGFPPRGRAVPAPTSERRLLNCGFSPTRQAPSLSMGRAVRAFRARASRNITGTSRSCCGVFPHAIAATFGNITPRVPPLPRPPFNTRVAVIRGKRRAHPVGMSRQSRGEVEAIRWRAVRAKHWFFWKIRAYYPANYME